MLFQLFRKKSFSGRPTIRVSNRSDPDQTRRFVGPDLGPNCLQKLSADDTRRSRVNIGRFCHHHDCVIRFKVYSYIVLSPVGWCLVLVFGVY